MTHFEFWLLLWNMMLSVGLVHLLIELKAMQKSTHQVTYMNPWAKEVAQMDQTFQDLSEEDEKELKKDQFGNIM